jgi:hypothetical protein
MNSSIRGVPIPLLFLAGAAFGILLASLIVLCTHSHRTAKSTNVRFGPAPIVAPVATWAAPDPMFDPPPMVEPASLSARPPPPSPPRPVVKKAVTRNNVRRHHPAEKHPATGDLLTAAL